MSSEWHSYRLADIALPGKDGLVDGPFGSNLPSSEYAPAGVPVIRDSNLTKGEERFKSEGFVYVLNSTAERLSRSLCLPNDIIFTKKGTLGQIGLIPFGLHPVYLLSSNQMRLRVDSALADPAFIYYYLARRESIEKIIRDSEHTGVPKINLGYLKSFPIWLPDLETQRVIAAALSTFDDRITLLRETNATLEAIAQALFKSWFVDFDPVRAKMEGRAPEGMDEATAALFPDALEESELGWVPKEWLVLRLGDATERITKGTTPTTLKRPFVDQGVNFIKAESMTGDGGFIPEKFAFIDDETHALLRRSQLQYGDVLISIAGTIGRIAVMSKDFLPANTNQAVALIRPFAKIIPSGWINRFLRLSESQNKMGEKVVQAVQANLSLGTLSDLKLVVPPEAVVGALYESGLAQIDASWVANDQRVRTLSTLRDTLLPRLISGQLRLPEAQAQMEEVTA